MVGAVDIEYGKVRVEEPRFSMSSGWDDGTHGFDLDSRRQVECHGKALLIEPERCLLVVIPPGEWSYQPYVVVDLRFSGREWRVDDLGLWLMTDMVRLKPDGTKESKWSNELFGRIRIDADPQPIGGDVRCSFVLQFDGETRIRGRFTATLTPAPKELPRVARHFIDKTG